MKRDLAELPGLLDEVDRLFDHGVIGQEELGAADFQIGSSVRMLLAFEDLERFFSSRPAEAFARRVVPEYPAIPAVLPADWLPGTADPQRAVNPYEHPRALAGMAKPSENLLVTQARPLGRRRPPRCPRRQRHRTTRRRREN